MAARRLEGTSRGARVNMTINGQAAEAYAGESIAAVLMAEGYRAFRHTDGTSQTPRGYFCGMGACFDCLVTVDGVPNVRACVTLVREGCDVQVVTAR